MKCPNDKNTELTKSDDYLDYCTHCDYETFAVRRAINDIAKNKDNLWDYSLPLPKFLEQFGSGFRNLAICGWEKKYGKEARERAMRELDCSDKELEKTLLKLVKP